MPSTALFESGNNGLPPNEVALAIAAMIDQALAAMKRTLERDR